MSSRANDLIAIPDSFWQRPEVTEALRSRDMGRFFALVQQYTGASQTQIGIAWGQSQGKVSDLIRGVAEVKHLTVFEEIADGLSFPDSARIVLGLAPRAPSHQPAGPKPREVIPEGDTHTALPPVATSGLLNLDWEDKQQEDDYPMRRRTFAGLTGTAMLNVVLADTPPDEPLLTAEPFARILTGQPGRVTGEALDRPGDIASLAAAVETVRRNYQASRYSHLLKTLPGLLARLHAASLSLDGEPRSRVLSLSAEAHHTAASVLLKLDDQGLAYLAADRSMRAAVASGDPVSVGSSARIIIHTLMNGGHFGPAISAASSHAERLDHEVTDHTPESLSVYGSILLRGAEAAARSGDRGTVGELIGEAEEAAQRLDVDGNWRWTAFGPTNVKLHRVNFAVALGDAGTAVDVARKVDLDRIPTAERKANFLVDTARALLQWGKHDKAYAILRAAEEAAHEEIAGRPSVHQVVRDLIVSAPPGIRRDAEQFAVKIGIAR